MVTEAWKSHGGTTEFPWKPRGTENPMGAPREEVCFHGNPMEATWMSPWQQVLPRTFHAIPYRSLHGSTMEVPPMDIPRKMHCAWEPFPCKPNGSPHGRTVRPRQSRGSTVKIPMEVPWTYHGIPHGSTVLPSYPWKHHGCSHGSTVLPCKYHGNTHGSTVLPWKSHKTSHGSPHGSTMETWKSLWKHHGILMETPWKSTWKSPWKHRGFTHGSYVLPSHLSTVEVRPAETLRLHGSTHGNTMEIPHGSLHGCTVLPWKGSFDGGAIEAPMDAQ